MAWSIIGNRRPTRAGNDRPARADNDQPTRVGDKRAIRVGDPLIEGDLLLSSSLPSINLENLASTIVAEL